MHFLFLSNFHFLMFEFVLFLTPAAVRVVPSMNQQSNVSHLDGGVMFGNYLYVADASEIRVKVYFVLYTGLSLWQEVQGSACSDSSRFGSYMVTDGSTLVVGAPQDSLNMSVNSGSAEVFALTNSGKLMTKSDGFFL